jgi:hypothetical protein
MKKILSFAAILLLMTSAFTCEKESETEEQIAPCNLQTEKIKEINNVETILLRGRPDINVPVTYSTYLIFDDTHAEFVTRTYSPMSFFRDICNFPQYVREWDIPQEGLPIIISGNLYTYKTPCASILNCSYLELTDLKRK